MQWNKLALSIYTYPRLPETPTNSVYAAIFQRVASYPHNFKRPTVKFWAVLAAATTRETTTATTLTSVSTTRILAHATYVSYIERPLNGMKYMMKLYNRNRTGIGSTLETNVWSLVRRQPKRRRCKVRICRRLAVLQFIEIADPLIQYCNLLNLPFFPILSDPLRSEVT